MSQYPPLEVKIWGELACFTRPEMKVERVSYPVMTPSAARGALEAILWKPEIRWEVREIHVLKPIRHLSVLRNEVNSRAVTSTTLAWPETGGAFYAEEDRAQRHTLALRDVAYVIRADLALMHEQPQGLIKYREMFTRRVRQGQCFHRPYLGCREFAASFGPPDGTEQVIEEDDDLGFMLFDLEYEPDGSGRGTPKFFHARLERGILRVPPELYRKEASRAAHSTR